MTAAGARGEPRARAARLGWIRRRIRDRLQAGILAAIDELRDDGYAFSALWPSGKPIEREQMARILYWNLQKNGTIQAEGAIGYGELEAAEVAEAERQISAGLDDGR